MTTLRWGMIGSSGWAEHTFAPAIGRARGHRLVAVLGSQPAGSEAFKAKHALEAAYTDLDRFLNHPDLDAVWVASPPDLHCAQTIAALEAGKHVLCEKPMAVSVVECTRMVRAAAAAGKELRVGFNNRAHPRVQALVRAAAEGRYGAALEARVQVYHPYAEAPPAWRQSRERSGGWAIGDLGTHLLDLLRWMMNAEAVAVSGHLTNRCWNLPTDDHAAIEVRFSNGAIGHVTACTGAAGGAPRVEFYGTEGYCVLRGGLFGMAGEIESSHKRQPARLEKFPAFDTYTAEVEAFGAQVRGRDTGLANGEDGAANISLVAAARGY